MRISKIGSNAEHFQNFPISRILIVFQMEKVQKYVQIFQIVKFWVNFSIMKIS